MAPVHVMVAILRDAAGRILITQRPAGKVQAGRWEFPGGKLEPDEAPEAGLRRELLEELGIVAGPMRRLIEVRHAYPDFFVRLDVREIKHFGGRPEGRERQALKWVSADNLLHEDILEADRPIIQALRLPDFCLVTPDPGALSRTVFLDRLDASLRSGAGLLQLRAHSLSRAEFVKLAREVLPVCRDHRARLLLNGLPDLLDDVDADGIHVSSSNAMLLYERPVSANRLLSASCHSVSELRQAQRIAADMVLIGPVARTASHPEQKPIGWSGFRALAQQANVPAFALGGMSKDDLDKARAAGGRGVAAIRGLWQGEL